MDFLQLQAGSDQLQNITSKSSRLLNQEKADPLESKTSLTITHSPKNVKNATDGKKIQPSSSPLQGTQRKLSSTQPRENGNKVLLY